MVRCTVQNRLRPSRRGLYEMTNALIAVSSPSATTDLGVGCQQCLPTPRLGGTYWYASGLGVHMTTPTTHRGFLVACWLARKATWVALLTAMMTANADEVLLAQLSDVNSGSSGISQGVLPPAPTTFTPSLELTDNLSCFEPGCPGFPTSCVGCAGFPQLPLNVANPADPLTFKITPADPGWNAFFRQLSDSNDSLVLMGQCLYPTTAIVGGCNPTGGGGPESLSFGSVGAFKTRTVDFIDVTITAADFTWTPTLAEYNFSTTWQFWGSGTPTSVPEPGILPLLLPGIAGLVLLRRRRDCHGRAA